MKVGIVGAGAVATACMFAMTLRGSAREIVMVNRDRKRARGAVADLQYGTVVAPPVNLRAGDFEDLKAAGIIVITVGANEKTGGATDRSDPAGRLRLLRGNAAIFQDIIPRVVASAPEALLLVVTDPPDPLADIARKIAKHDRVLSSGTFLDSLRFRFHLGKQIGVDAKSVEANVIGEHGTSQVYLWSTARVGGTPLIPSLIPQDANEQSFRNDIEDKVRFANISIIEGTGASQFGIGVTVARIVEIVTRDTRAIVPIGSYQPAFGVTLSLPSQFGCHGIVRVLMPSLAADEKLALEGSADTLRSALASVENA
ncbi:MAG: lactate dehydrogenase [Betaproteobacteria bacterium]